MQNANETSAIIAGLQSVRSRAPDVTHKAIERAIEYLAAQEARLSELAIHAAKCPYPTCGGVMKVREGLLSGEYRCLCHACKVQLVWALTAEGKAEPVLMLVEQAQHEKLDA